MSKRNYVWTVEIEQAEEPGKYNVWLGEENASAAEYTNVTAEDIGKILVDDIHDIQDIWNEEK